MTGRAITLRWLPLRRNRINANVSPYTAAAFVARRRSNAAESERHYIFGRSEILFEDATLAREMYRL